MTDVAARPEITADRLVDVEDVLELFGRLKWAMMVGRDPERFQAAIDGSWPVVTAWDQGRLVGICRVVTDGQYTAYIADLAVDPDYQGKGLGSAMARKALALLDGFDTIALITSIDKVNFWERLDFTNVPGGMILRRW